jgi:hypothetical protein
MIASSCPSSAAISLEPFVARIFGRAVWDCSPGGAGLLFLALSGWLKLRRNASGFGILLVRRY